MKAGTVALVGRPNAGKSTLLNRFVGEKVAITSDKPQTTRHRLVGIRNDDRGQMVFFDTPGIHKPLHRMNRDMVREATAALTDADVICLIVDAKSGFGKGDARLLGTLGELPGPKVLALNKVDAMKKPQLLPLLARYGEADLFTAMVPVSATQGDGCEDLLEELRAHLPDGEPLYDPELFTVHPERFLVAELVREKLLERCRAELPFSSAVLIERWEEEGSTSRIYASILVEKDGQKKIVIGRGGEMVKAIGIAARRDVEALLDRHVDLRLHVRVEPGWRDDRRLLAEMSPLGRLD